METLSSDPPSSRFLLNIAGIILCNAGCVFSQPAIPQGQVQSPIKVVLYYTLNWELTTQEKSYFRREANFDLGDMVFDGVYRDYDKENKLMAEGLYVHGEKRGLQNEYFNDRSLKSTIEYLDHDFTIWELQDASREVKVKGGTGSFTLYYLYVSGLVSEPSWKDGILDGEFRRGMRVGTWTYRDRYKVKTDEEIYENGKLVKRIHFSDDPPVELDYTKDIIVSVNTLLTDNFAFDHDAFKSLNEVFEKSLSYPADYERGIAFPGGIRKLLMLLSKNAEIPEGYVAVVKLKVDEKGQVLKYNVDNVADKTMKDRALKSMKVYESLLFPAIRNGKPHASSIYLPISGGQEWTDMLTQTPSEELVREEHGSTTSLLNILGLALVLLLLGLSFI